MKKAVESKLSDSVSNPKRITATMKASTVVAVVTYTITDISFESLSALIFIFRVFIASTSAHISKKTMRADRNIVHEKERSVKQLIAK